MGGGVLTGSLTASCGHQCNETVSVRYHDEVCDAIDGFQPCIVYAEFCPPCAKAAEAWPEFIPPDTPDDDLLTKPKANGQGRNHVNDEVPGRTNSETNPIGER